MTTPLTPPFTKETALQKVQFAEDAWNSRNPARAVLAYSENSEWRNRELFLRGRDEIQKFLTQKWERELEYRLKKTLWSYTDNKIAVMFEYESHDANNQWWRSHGNELWQFNDNGLMTHRFASINDNRISADERRLTSA